MSDDVTEDVRAGVSVLMCVVEVLGGVLGMLVESAVSVLSVCKVLKLISVIESNSVLKDIIVIKRAKIS